MSRTGILGDFNSAALWAGVTAFVWYAFGGVTLQIAVAEQLGLSVEQTSSWVFIIWMVSPLTSIAMSLYYRQPLPIGWTIPGLIYLGTLASRFTWAELIGANLVAGIIILVLALAGIGGRLMKWLPLPIIMGMFAGSILVYVVRLVTATVEDLAVAGTAVACYLGARLVASPRVPPVGLAVIGGGIAVALTGTASPQAFEWTHPVLQFASISLSLPALLAVSLPMVVLAMGLGNVQGLGFLIAQGYEVPVNRVSVVVGLNSVVHAIFGGHPSTVARTGAAIVASPDAGPPSGRYWAVLVSAVLSVGIALTATPIASFLNIVPPTYIYAIAGLAILSSFQDALERSFRGALSFGATIAFIVAATPFAWLGITSAFWAIVAGMAASLIAERRQLLAFWSSSATAGETGRESAA